MPRNNVLRSQAREMVFNVSKFMKKEAEEGMQLNIKAVQKRTAAATAVSERTVRRICTEYMNSLKADQPVLRTPGKKRFSKKKVTGLNSYTKGLIKRCIHSYPYTVNELPTVTKLLKNLQEDIKFNGSATSLRRILKEMGYCWEKTGDDKKVLIEKMSIRVKRIQYLENIMRYRREGRAVIYTGASFINPSDPTDSNGLIVYHMSKGEQVVMVNAGSEKGFVPDALLLFKCGTKSENFNEVMNYENYEKWVLTQLIPNLPPSSVIVIDSASYNNKEVDTVPTSYAKRAEMEEWLTENCIPYSSSMLKPQLYELICLNKCRLKRYRIDDIFKRHNHTVLRLPPHHTDLNPIELAWRAIKNYIAEKELTLNTDNVMKLVREKTQLIDEKEWTNFCLQTHPIEEEYKHRDHIIDKLTEKIVINVDVMEDQSESDKDMECEDYKDSDDESNDESEFDQILHAPKMIFVKQECEVHVKIESE